MGSRLLGELAGVLRGALRGSDLVYRYGGDEFVMIVPGGGAGAAGKISERVLAAVRRAAPEAGEGGGRVGLSVSIGVAEFPRDSETGEGLLGAADRMMYVAKRRGRGRACQARDYPPAPGP